MQPDLLNLTWYTFNKGAAGPLKCEEYTIDKGAAGPLKFEEYTFNKGAPGPLRFNLNLTWYTLNKGAPRPLKMLNFHYLNNVEHLIELYIYIVYVHL